MVASIVLVLKLDEVRHERQECGRGLRRELRRSVGRDSDRPAARARGSHAQGEARPLRVNATKNLRVKVRVGVDACASTPVVDSAKDGERAEHNARGREVEILLREFDAEFLGRFYEFGEGLGDGCGLCWCRGDIPEDSDD